jgi:CBS domain containing-hemolysin-like protein
MSPITEVPLVGRVFVAVIALAVAATVAIHEMRLRRMDQTEQQLLADLGVVKANQTRTDEFLGEIRTDITAQGTLITTLMERLDADHAETPLSQETLDAMSAVKTASEALVEKAGAAAAIFTPAGTTPPDEIPTPVIGVPPGDTGPF